MKRILLILTGGTIGSTVNNGIIDVEHANCIGDNSTAHNGINAAKNETIICAEKDTENDNVVFDIRRPFNILSENMTPEYWNILCGR